MTSSYDLNRIMTSTELVQQTLRQQLYAQGLPNLEQKMTVPFLSGDREMIDG